MKNKKNIHDVFNESLNEIKEEEKAKKANRDLSVKEKAFSIDPFNLIYESIIEAKEEDFISKGGGKSVKQILSEFGKLAALNAKFGSFDSFMKGLNLPQTGIISLFSHYEHKNMLVVVCPDKVDLSLVDGTFTVPSVKSNKNFLLNHLNSSVFFFNEDVQIGMREDRRTPYVVKIRFPVTIACFLKSEGVEKGVNLGNAVFSCLKKNYPEAKTVSELFAYSVINSSDRLLETNNFLSNDEIEAVKKLTDYRIKKNPFIN